MNISTIEDARAAKDVVQQLIHHIEVRALWIGIVEWEDGYAVKVNFDYCCVRPKGLPKLILGVPILVEVTCSGDIE